MVTDKKNVMMTWQSISIVLVFQFFHLSSTQDKDILVGTYECPTPWVGTAEKCYYFQMFDSSIPDAKAACQVNSANLVSINTEEEMDFMSQQLDNLPATTKSWLTSGRRTAVNKADFYWLSDDTNVRINFQPWINTNVLKSDGMVIVLQRAVDTWKWNLVKDTFVGPFICEIDRKNAYKILASVRDYDYGLNVTDPSAVPKGPHFILEPQDVIYDENINSPDLQGLIDQFIVIECMADAQPPPTYKWFKIMNGVLGQIYPLTDSRITISNGKLKINLPSRRYNDDAFYYCVAQNKYGAILSHQIQLRFASLSDFQKDPRQPIQATEYSFAILQCNPPASGYSKLRYIWTKNDNIQDYINSQDEPHTFISENGNLYFEYVTRSVDQGDYQCTVFPPSGASTALGAKTSQVIRLTIRTSGSAQQNPTFFSEFPRVFPSDPRVGDDIGLECIAQGTSQSSLTYTWTLNKGPLPPSAIFSNRNRRVDIPNVQLIHQGTYACRAQSDSTSLGTGLSVTKNMTLQLQQYPVFVLPLANQFMDQSTDLTWTCIGMGIPRISYTWLRNSVVMNITALNSNVVFANRYAINNNVLTIKQVQSADEGMYQCKIRNDLRTEYSSAELRVLSFAPTFNKYPLLPRQVATISGSTNIRCTPEAAPAADITWFKDGRALSPSTDRTSNMYILPNGYLVIQKVAASDAGNYTCHAQNMHGEASASGQLTVLATTTLTTPPQDMTIAVNRSVFLECEASFNPQMDVTYEWYQNVRKIDFEIVRIVGEVPAIYVEPYFRRGSGATRGGLSISPVQYFHEGNYTCLARTASAVVGASARLVVLGPPYPPISVTVVEGLATKSSIVVKWDIGINTRGGIYTTTAYHVEAIDSRANEWRWVKRDITGQDLTNRVTNVTGLNPFSQYSFRVRGSNAVGMGDPSPASDFYSTLGGPPVYYPRDLGRCTNKVGTLCIQWSCVPLEDRDGDGFAYKVKFKEVGPLDEKWRERLVPQPNTDEPICKYVETVGQRKSWTYYDVTVQSYNNLGVSPESPKITIKSSMAMPSQQPKLATAWQYNATACLVDYIPAVLLDKEGYPYGYRINYWNTQTMTPQQAFFKIFRGQFVVHGMIIGLDPYTNYTFTVQVFNEAGLGPPSDPSYQRTVKHSPMEAPQEVRVWMAGKHCVRLSWRGVDTTVVEEPILGYKIFYWRSSENRYLASEVDVGRTIHYTLCTLDKDTLYDIRIAGYSRGGDGLLSSPIMQVYLGEECFIREDSPDTNYIYRCKGQNDYFSLYYPNFACRLKVSYLLITLTVVLGSIVKILL